MVRGSDIPHIMGLLANNYGLYFPCDGKTEDALFDDEDMELRCIEMQTPL